MVLVLRRARALGLSVGVVAVVSVVVALLAPPAATADATPPPSPAPPVLPPFDDAAAPAPTRDGVAAAIGPLVRRGLDTGAAIVVDPLDGSLLYGTRQDRPLIPASTTKLATAAAALSVLGPQTRLATVVRRDGDTLYLVGGGDPTLVRSQGGNPLAGGSASLRDLAEAVALTTPGPVQLVYDTSAFRGPELGPGWPASFPAAGVAAPVTALVVDGGRVRPGSLSRVQDPAKQAAQAFVELLLRKGVAVTSVGKGKASDEAQEVARVESPTISDIVQRMLTESENNYAEALAHLVGGAVSDTPTFRGGAEATTRTLTDLGIDTSGLDLADGSGLSSRNRIPARLLADVLVEAVQGDDAALSPIAPGLSIAGLTGTLADRFTAPGTRPARGFVHGKTGTLTGVSSLAGIVLDSDGRLLVFALLANRVSSLAATRETMDAIASRLAGCGCS